MLGSSRLTRRRLHHLAPIVLSLALTSCKSPGTGGAGGEAGAAASSKAAASVTTCAVTPAGGVVVASSPHAPHDQAIAAGPGGVLVTWVETLPGVPCRGGSTCAATEGHARVLDVAHAALDPVPAPAVVPLSNGSDVESASNLAPLALAGGGLYAAHCTSAIVSGKARCDFPHVAGSSLADSSWAWDPHNSALQLRRAAAVGVGATGLLVVPAYGELFLFASGSHGHRELLAETGNSGADPGTALPNTPFVDSPAMAAAGSDQAVVVWRGTPTDASKTAKVLGAGAAIHARLVGTDGHARGAVTTLSAAGDDVGAPAVAWVGGAVLAVYARRHAHTDAWHLELARWTPGSAPARSEITTGSAAAVAPAIVAAPGAGGCSVLTWTEGEGSGTVVRAGRLCPSAAAPTGVGQLSRDGVEAGASVLAAEGDGVFVAWQEIPGHGAPTEVRAGKVAVAAGP